MSEHIKAELDFIPVAERLPEGDGVLKPIRAINADGELDLLMARYNGRIWLSAAGHLVEGDGWEVTHWADGWEELVDA